MDCRHRSLRIHVGIHHSFLRLFVTAMIVDAATSAGLGSPALFGLHHIIYITNTYYKY